MAEEGLLSGTVHGLTLLSAKNSALHRFMTRSPHEPKCLLFGSRVGERYTLFLFVSALFLFVSMAAVVKKRRLLMLS